MIMPLRFKVLIDTPSLPGRPRQPIPNRFEQPSAAAAEAYLHWLLEQGAIVRTNFFKMVLDTVEIFNKAETPEDLGLSPKRFPFRLWREQPKSSGSSQYAVGQIVECSDLAQLPRLSVSYHFQEQKKTICVVMNSRDSMCEILPQGRTATMLAVPALLQPCTGGGVMMNAPLKGYARAQHKVLNHYESEIWPPAASVVDIVRCTILFDDPYAMAVMVAYLQRCFKVCRVKNRFEQDVLEEVTVAKLLLEFHSAETASDEAPPAFGPGIHVQCGTEHGTIVERGPDGAWRVDIGGETRLVPEAQLNSPRRTNVADAYEKQYRDVLLNVEVPTEHGPFICEIQIGLASIAVLKKSEQKVYTLLRMEHASELQDIFVFCTPPQYRLTQDQPLQSSSSEYEYVSRVCA